MDTLERDGLRYDDAAENYREFIKGNRKAWTPYIRSVVMETQRQVRKLRNAYNRGDFYNEFWGGPDNMVYNLILKETQAEAWKQIEVGLKTEPSISGKVVEVIMRPSSRGYPLGDPQNNDSIVIKCDRPTTTLTLTMPLMPEWNGAEQGDYVQFFTTDEYYRATLKKRR